MPPTSVYSFLYALWIKLLDTQTWLDAMEKRVGTLFGRDSTTHFVLESFQFLLVKTNPHDRGVHKSFTSIDLFSSHTAI